MGDMRVLVVDDEVEFLQTLIKRLKKRRIDVEGAPGGEQALASLEVRLPDVVVLDVKMPNMDGISVLKEIKKFNPLTEVIMLTGHADMEAAAQGMELGAFDYLMKPIAIDELLYKIEDAYRRKSIQDSKIMQVRQAGGVTPREGAEDDR